MFVPTPLALLLCLVPTQVISFEDEVIILDTNQDPGWKINTYCIYAETREDDAYGSCRANVTEDASTGYWSVCDHPAQSCRLSYVVQDKIPYAIRIRAFVVPNGEGVTVDIELRYSSGGSPTYQYYTLPSSAAWETFESTFDQEMAPGSTIDISTWGKYADGKDFLMVDRVELFVRPEVITTTGQPTTTTQDPGNPSDVVLDTVEELNGWVIGSCVYAASYLDNEFQGCRVDITGDTEGNEGYWSSCNNPQDCRIRYSVIPQKIPTGIKIRTYMMPSGDGQSPIITLIYRNPEGSNQFQEFLSEGGGWKTIEYEFGQELLPGATIEVKQTSSYEDGKDFAMVDKIILMVD